MPRVPPRLGVLKSRIVRLVVGDVGVGMVDEAATVRVVRHRHPADARTTSPVELANRT
jgi:hypothetical protein